MDHNAAKGAQDSAIKCRMFRMPGSEEFRDSSEESRRTRLEEKLREVDQQLRNEMRARGFDPDQDDNLALTAPLAKLYSEREELREELESLTGE
jgi:hypothetical protein